ncbi:glycosyltransferase family A protein [Aliivibrio fischeri]|uniref:glycosyltransferase family A protein n=1 Tax=Aliivibrio fischeri TaxID=668 RepID=UPI0012D88B60|nr:glycosyltransferase family A protein [Aliivibrio fischeri]MUI52514.1 glycosyltransferase [Aliivibrio fischeri]
MLDVVIATINDRIYNLDKVIKIRCENVRYIITHQITNNKKYNINYNERDDVIYYSLDKFGLSVNRNFGLSKVSSEFFLISDDDVEFVNGAFDKIIETLQSNSAYDLVSFQALSINDNSLLREYPSAQMEINYNRGFFPTSIEIAGRSSAIYKMPKFREEFGVGSIFPSCEESIFLRDSIKNNIKISFFPIPIVKHPDESTGDFKYKDKKIIEATGAYYYIVYGFFLGFFVIIRNILKYHYKYKNEMSLVSYSNFLFKGFFKRAWFV